MYKDLEEIEPDIAKNLQKMKNFQDEEFKDIDLNF